MNSRDAEARAYFETANLNPDDPDTWATQLANFLAANPLSQNIFDGLSERVPHQQLRPIPDAIHDYVSAQDIPVSLILLRLLGQAGLGGT